MPILNRPLRVMHIISGDLWAGAEAQAFTLLKHLKNEVSLHVVLMNEGELSNRLQALDIPVTIVPETQLSSFLIIKKLILLIREFKPDVLHTHRQKENILGNFANLLASIPFKKRAKSVRTTHGAPEFHPIGKQKIQVWLDNWAGKYLQEIIIAVSNDLAEKLQSIFPAEKIRVIHNGVNVDSLTATASTADFKLKEPNTKHIGIIGRIEPVKRIDIFIEMARLLLADQSKTPPLKFHIIGDGSLRKAMEEKVRGYKLNNSIYFHGHRSDMTSCISSLDVIVMCSDHEGTPMTALEATALNTPLVAHKVGGLREIFSETEPEQLELLVAEHKPEAYAKKVADCLTVPPQIQLKTCYLSSTNAQSTLAIYLNN